ncbi:MAG: major capsid protein [Microviridae sp.]|nr:MAG: major capsid protein [Microviridae sp.]
MSKANIFNQIQVKKPQSNWFDLSHDVKLSCNMAELIPVMCIKAMPGDKFNCSQEALTRLAPMVAPMMHRVDQTFHTFFVPNRILWPNWEKYITNTKLEATDLLPVHPYCYADAANYSRLSDYLGIPTPLGVEREFVSAIPFAVYQMIYNEYYRDQNMIDPVPFELVDGFNQFDDLGILRTRAWEHDYFTSALPFAQKGDPVTIPIAGSVILDPAVTNVPGHIVNSATHLPVAAGNLSAQGGAGFLQADTTPEPAVYDPNGTLLVDSANTTINDLRKAYVLQRWLEKSARAGSRYTEQLKVQFDVRSSDARLQRPEYITGTKSPIVISEVLQTGESATTPQGNMAGHGVSVTEGQYGDFFCEEHGYIMTIMSVMPKTAYQQGIEKHFLEIGSPLDDYPWPDFGNIGEQPVENRELYAFQGDAGKETFGYLPRYAQYKYMPNRVAGDFRTNLNFWHMGRIFSSPPALTAEFIECDPTHRVFAVTDPDEQKLWMHVYNKVKANRRLPYFGTPS